MTVPEEWLPTTEPGLSADFHYRLPSPRPSEREG